jgi:hypothetical protein
MGQRTATKQVLEADVKGGVGVRSEDDSGLARNVLGPAVFVANGITDLVMINISEAQVNPLLDSKHIHEC